MQNIQSYNFKNKKALVRVDFNVPLNEHFQVTDDTRIRAALPTINTITNNGGAVIIMTHLGRPKNGPEDKYSLKHVISKCEQLLDTKVHFVDDCVGTSVKEKTEQLKPGEILLLENLRFYKEETKGNSNFAEQLAGLADVYVNDAFGTAHRAHASTSVIAQFFIDKMFGLLMERELENLDRVLKNPEHPFTAILGGAKVSGKVEVIANLIDKVDNIIIGGGMAYTFIKAKGYSVGKSLVEEELLETATNIMEKAEANNTKIHLPIDTIVADSFSNDAESKEVKINNMPEAYMGLDIGGESIRNFSDVIKNSKTILWNGPMGVFEMENFAKGTQVIAKAITEATSKGAYSLVGGGDSVAAVNQMGLANQVSYVSTGGGAMLEYIEGKDLPGVKAIRG